MYCPLFWQRLLLLVSQQAFVLTDFFSQCICQNCILLFYQMSLSEIIWTAPPDLSSSSSGLSEVQSPRGFTVRVPELRGNAEELKNVPTVTWLNNSLLSFTWPPTMSHLRALQGPLAAVLADDPLCVSFSRLIRCLMTVFLFLPLHLHIISSRCAFAQAQVSVFWGIIW